MQKEKKRTCISFWIQITGILLVGVITSVVVLIMADHHDTQENVQTYTVTFADLDGTVIETIEVERGKGVHPPKLSYEGVFRGWSGAFNAVTADIEVHPQFHTITETNLFYFDTVYAEEGKTFALDLRVGGKVNVSSGTLTICYDTDVLTFQKADGMGDCTVTEDKAGELVIVFDGKTPITTQALLTQLQFRAERKDAYCTELSLSASDMKVVVDGQELPADCATINNKVYFLQEVG